MSGDKWPDGVRVEAFRPGQVPPKDPPMFEIIECPKCQMRFEKIAWKRKHYDEHVEFCDGQRRWEK